jgi:protein SCO1/2
MRGGRTVALILATALAAWLAPPAHADHPVQRVSRVGAGWPVDAFSLVDQHGKPYTQDNLLGRWTFVLFGDTRCGEPCAAALGALAGVYQRIARTQKTNTTQVVFISFAGDSSDQLREYLAPYPRGFLGASGAPQTVVRLAEDLGAAEAAQASSGAPADAATLTHPGMLSLVDPEGMVWGQFLPPFEVKALTARYLKARVGR